MHSHKLMSQDEHVRNPDALNGSPPFILHSPFPAARRRLPDAEHVGIFQQLADGLIEQAALIDAEDWTILAVNDAWKRTVKLNGFSDFSAGLNYYDELCKIAGTGYGPAQAALAGMEEIRQGKRTSFRMVYDGGGQQAGRKFEARIALMKIGGRRYIRITRYDVSELLQLRGMRRGFNGALMKVQEDERRRMGRELHDSGLQLLAGLSLSLARLRRALSEDEKDGVIGEMEGLLVEAQREFRSISFLAHPPQLERLGFEEAVRQLVKGFGQRAGLETGFQTEGAIHVASPDAEHAIYRVVQEAISNVHRHSHASSLAVQLIRRERMLHVVVADDGRGIPADLSHGVGLMGMRSRLRELGGRLTIHNGSPGTIIVASLPAAVLSEAPLALAE